MIIGFLIKYIGGENRLPITEANCSITSATKKLHISVVNGSKYSYRLTGEVLNTTNDQGSELEQKVHIPLTNLKGQCRAIWQLYKKSRRCLPVD